MQTFTHAFKLFVLASCFKAELNITWGVLTTDLSPVTKAHSMLYESYVSDNTRSFYLGTVQAQDAPVLLYPKMHPGASWALLWYRALPKRRPLGDICVT